MARRAPLGRGWLLLLLLLAGLFVLLRGVHAAQDAPTPSGFATGHVVVVGVTGRAEPDATDRRVIDVHAGDAQVGAVAIRSRYVGQCAAAGWTTLGAGRRAAVGPAEGPALCDPRVVDGRVPDWDARLAAAAADGGDARLGTLAGSVPHCVAAVGPGAALAAARPDGTLARYTTPEDFLADGLPLACPITLVDAGASADAVVARLGDRDDVTLVVTGIGPAPGSGDPSLQVVYRIGAALPGWLTSASTRRTGVVTLTDLTRTLIDVGAPDAVPLTVDGSPLAVTPAAVSADRLTGHLHAVRALSDSAVTGYYAMAVGGVPLFLVLLAGVATGRLATSRLVLTLGSVLLASMMLVGALPWPRSDHPGLYVGIAVWLWMLLLTPLLVLLARRLDVPAVVVGSAVTVAAFTVDAALGGPMEPGSLLNSRPVFALRWYGFGNVTFAAYASAGLLLAGYLADRFLRTGRRRAALVAVAGIGFGVVVCEGWPTMGTDFGGVIALTPGVLWLLLALSGVRVTGPKLAAIAVAAVLAITAISLADWARGPDRRSHLGNFVQRVLDRDAGDVVARKAVASFETIVSPLGVGSILVGGLLWLAMYRYGEPLVRARFTTLRPTMTAALAVGVLGTLLNDGGISVFLTLTAAVTCTVAWFCLDEGVRRGWRPDLRAWTTGRRDGPRR